MSKVSILIAAYNVEEYIAETLNSAIAQTLKDIEIIVVDDGSTDRTNEIALKFAELDSRIKVIRHEINGGLVRVRQTGLKNSCGEYVMFLDGDDKLARNACEKAYKAITSEKVDMLQFNVKVLFVPPLVPDATVERELRKAMRSPTHKVISVSKAGVLDEKAVGDVINFNLWNKIYKRTLLETAAQHVPDEYLNMAEDVLYSFFIHYHAHSYSYIPDKLYKYRYGCGMSTTATVTERIMKAIAKNAYIYEYLNEWTKSVDSEKECELALCRAHKQLYTHIADTYFFRTETAQKEFFSSEILKYGKPEDLVLAFSNYLYNNKVSGEQIANECATLDIFSAKRTKAETIGVYYFRMYNGGVENVMSSLMDIWVKAGYNVVLFTDEEPNKNDYYINPSVKRVIVPAIKKKDFFNQKDRITSFKNALIEHKVDVMVYNAWANPDILLDEMIIKSCGVNLVIHTHNLFCYMTDSWHGPSAYFCSTLPALYSFADSVISLSDVDDAWWKIMGIRSFKTKNPIQIKTDIKAAPLNGKNMLLVGRISEEKQVLEALKIAELVKKEIPDAKLTVVGKGDDPGYLARVDDYIAKNDLSNTVDMVGFKSDVIPYYMSADVMLSTSRYEGAPLTWLEGKLCGLPLVCYELPHLDFIRDGKGIVIVEQLNAKAAADAIVKILKDDNLKKEMGLKSRESAEEYLDIDLAEHWKSIFEQTLVPKAKAERLYKLPVSEAAVRIAVKNYTAGILARMDSPQSNNSPRCAELEDELARFKRSESYRLGMFLTFIPRKIKDLLQLIFRRR